MMTRDIRETDVYREAETFYRAMWRVASGEICDAADIHASSDGKLAAFTAIVMDELQGVPPTRIALVDLATGASKVISRGPNSDRAPKFSPARRSIAFLSDRRRAGDFQLYLFDIESGATRSTPRVEGWVEYLHWSPDGTRILLGVAGHGADTAGTQGAVPSKNLDEVQSWMPAVADGNEHYHWRHAWIYELATDSVSRLPTDHANIWESAWCGNHSIVAVLSKGPSEGLWYDAELHLVQVASGVTQRIFSPNDQIGWPAASPSGKFVAIAEAVCSDRSLVAGDLRLIDTASGEISKADTHGVNVMTIEWCSEDLLLMAGVRRFETVVGLYEVASGAFTERWISTEISVTGPCIRIAALNDSGDFTLVGEGFTRAPEIAVVRGGEYRVIESFGAIHDYVSDAIGAVDRITWAAPDGLQIQGWLLRPRANGPYPLVLNIHGCPVSNWRNNGWCGPGACPY